MRMVDCIVKKRDGQALSEEEIRQIIAGYTAGEIPDYQMAAFAMAVYFQGMTDGETAVLTDAMMRSGDRLDLSRFGKESVDKHSTGGVGDKTTLIVAPIVASLGGKVAKMTGRGLGHTGGTADKLESIPGFRISLPEEEFLRQVESIGLAVIAQSGNLTPADKKLYALRDVTGTVESMPLITASIMSKKLAAGSYNIVLDVKIGSGAFVKTLDQGRQLAQSMVAIGKHWGRNMTAVLTNMDIPLGAYIGNSLEVMEAAETLQGRGSRDLQTVCQELAARMVMACRGWSLEESRQAVEKSIEDGSAFRKFRQWIAAQGGDPLALEDYSRLPQAPVVQKVLAPCSGYLTGMDTEKIGQASMLLGAGRAQKEDAIDPAAGICLAAKTGDQVEKGQVLATFYTSEEEKLIPAESEFLKALSWGQTPPPAQPLIYGVIE